jgi:hypothetical protein
MQRHHPASHYVLIDDKLRILAAVKRMLGHRLTTIFPRQGHYALDAAGNAAYPPADLGIEHIGELTRLDWPTVRGLARPALL